MVAIGSDEHASRVTVGAPATFAIEKKTAYIKFDPHEYRLLVLKMSAGPMAELVGGVIGLAVFGFLLYKVVKAVAVMIKEAEGADNDED